MTPRSPMTGGVLVRIFACFAAGYFLSYLFRTVNAVLGLDLSRDLGLDAAALGILTSAYFIAFGAVQVPLGILLDRYGPRRVEAALLVLAALGAALFAVAEGLGFLIVGRALIGVGVSACLMAGFKALASWFPRERLPFFNSLFMVAGALGAITAATPVELALQIMDWRGVFWLLAGCTLAVAGLLLVAVPEVQTSQPDTGLRAQIDGIRQIFSAGIFWRLAPLTIVVQGGYLAFQGLLAGEWLRLVDGLPRLEAAHIVTEAAVTMALGFLSSGVLADVLSRRGIGAVVVSFGGMSLFMIVQAVLALGVPIPPWLSWGLFGLLGSYSAVTYAVLSQQFPPHLSGRVNTAINLLVFAAAFIVQAMFAPISRILGDGASGYRLAMALLLGVEVLAWIWLLVPRRTIRLPWRLPQRS